jgi:hypothetical protein
MALEDFLLGWNPLTLFFTRASLLKQSCWNEIMIYIVRSTN